MSYDKIFMGLKDLPPVPAVPDGANYILFRQTGKLLTLSGNGPLRGSKIPPEYLGKVGKDLTTAQGYKAARLTAMNLLLVARSAIKSLDKVHHILHIDGSVHCTDTFTDQASVINGCSDLLVEIFGENGKHTRSALGCNALAFNISVEISMSLMIK
ncbi:MAG: RidA family protein [Flavobacteriaceae bacterium]